ncbi:MAG: hypothetical protein KatS3mg102_0639 [Planctomycetota bacterium]|nr:MAG: hypothetical protein KatS3mg102_0639 [Planctomycetota bacterium]
MDGEQNVELAEARARWQRALERARLRQAKFETLSGEPLEPLYEPRDPDDPEFLDKIGYPGEYPFTRGPYHAGYRRRLWTMRQFAGFGSAEDTNRRFKYLLGRQATGQDRAFDGLRPADAHGPRQRRPAERGRGGQVRRGGRARSRTCSGCTRASPRRESTVDDDQRARGGDLGDVHRRWPRAGGAASRDLRGTLQNDILKEFHAQNEFIFPPEPSVQAGRRHHRVRRASSMPKWNPVSISGYHIREAGATAAAGAGLHPAPTGWRTSRPAWRRGLDVDAFGPAAVVLLQRATTSSSRRSASCAPPGGSGRGIMRERYGAKNERELVHALPRARPPACRSPSSSP